MIPCSICQIGIGNGVAMKTGASWADVNAFPLRDCSSNIMVFTAKRPATPMELGSFQSSQAKGRKTARETAIRNQGDTSGASSYGIHTSFACSGSGRKVATGARMINSDCMLVGISPQCGVMY